MILIHYVLCTELHCKHKHKSLSPADCEEKAAAAAEEYSARKSELLESGTQAAWEYYTSISEDSQEASNEAAKVMAAFEKESWKNIFTQYDYEQFEDEELKRR